MGRISDLLNQAAGSPQVIFSEDEQLLTPSSTVPEILDWIMIRLCSELNVNEMAFKGGYMLSKLLPENEVRGTRDIDFSIMTREYYDEIKKVMSTIGDELISMGVSSSYEVKEGIEPTMSGGVNYYMVDESKHLGIDVGLHDITYGVHSVNITGIDINAFTPERMLSDKISAMFTRKRFRRSKDLYDLYVITNTFNVDMAELSRLIKKRGELDYGLSPIRDEIMGGYRNAYDKLRLDNDGVIDRQAVLPSFDIVMDRLRLFVNNLDTEKAWDHIARRMI